MIYAHLPIDIRKKDRVWLKKGVYGVVRRFDNTRWLIQMAHPRDASRRVVTLIQVADMRLSTSKGEKI